MRTLGQDILELIAAANPGPVFLSDLMQAYKIAVIAGDRRDRA